MCDIDGNRQQRYHLERINDMLLAADGKVLIAVMSEHKICLVRLHERRKVRMQPSDALPAFKASSCLTLADNIVLQV